MRLERTYPRGRFGRFGRLAVCHAATPFRGFLINRYPGKVIGVAFGWGRRPYLSYISPVTVVHDEVMEAMSKADLLHYPEETGGPDHD